MEERVRPLQRRQGQRLQCRGCQCLELRPFYNYFLACESHGHWRRSDVWTMPISRREPSAASARTVACAEAGRPLIIHQPPPSARRARAFGFANCHPVHRERRCSNPQIFTFSHPIHLCASVMVYYLKVPTFMYTHPI